MPDRRACPQPFAKVEQRAHGARRCSQAGTGDQAAEPNDAASSVGSPNTRLGDGYERAARAALVEVSASVAAGDNVILNPQVDLADGRKVTAIS